MKKTINERARVSLALLSCAISRRERGCEDAKGLVLICFPVKRKMQNNDTKKKTEKISEDSFSSKNNTALFFSLAPSIGSVRARVSRNERLFVCACVEVVAAQQEEISLSLASLFCCLSLSLSLVHCRFLSLILSLLSHCLSLLNLFSLSNNNVNANNN